MKKFKIGGQFSGVGAFDQALIRLGVDYENVYQADWDKYARQTYLHNYEEPEYYVKDVYDTPTHEITEKHGSLDIMMFSPPCQSFSLAGKRKGEDDDRGILFYNSHEFIKINKPRYFIFENVKGLLSDAGGKTFGRWIEYLGGKSVNGTANMFPSENSVPYHIYYRVLNAKNYNIPQNRERVFIIGIRDDDDNNFSWPKEEVLERRLKDVLESDVDEKYYLSDTAISGFVRHTEKQMSKGNGFKFEPKDGEGIGNCITARVFKMGVDDNYIKVKSATKQGYELAEIGEDSINFEHPDSKTRRGRVGVGVGQTLTTSCNQGVAIGAIRGRNPDNPTSRVSGQPTQQTLEINHNGTSNALTTVQKDNVVVVANLPGKHEQNSRVYGTNGLSPTLTTMQGGGQEPKIAVNDVVQLNPYRESGGKQPYQHNRIYADYGVMTTLDTECGRPSVYTDYKIRKLTPRECFRLMDFPDTFSWPVSDSQAYKQAGNSICVGVLERILKNILQLQ